SYRQSIPHNIEPLLILDASGNKAMEYKFIAKSQGNVVRLPSTTKCYRNLDVTYIDKPAGHVAYRTKEKLLSLSQIAAEEVCSLPPGEPVVIFHHQLVKAPATTLKLEISSRVRAMGGNPGLIRFCQYGYHKGTNEYRDFKHAILIGVHQQPISSITSL